MHFIEALFHCWSQVQDDFIELKKVKRVAFIDIDDFYTKMQMFGFIVNRQRYEEITNLAFENRPKPKKADERLNGILLEELQKRKSEQYSSQMRKSTFFKMKSMVLPSTNNTNFTFTLTQKIANAINQNLLRSQNSFLNMAKA